jgi:hypothetical protein
MAMDVRTWVERQQESHARADREEAERFRRMSTAERARVLQGLCRSAMQALASAPEATRQRALAFRAPLPDSSVKALARLRKAYDPGRRRS